MTAVEPAVFANTLDAYMAAGWRSVLPLPPGQKSPPPDGYTGKTRVVPNEARLSEWRATCPPTSNIALALPYDLVGIDVDHHDAKRGADRLAELEATLGAQLPPTIRSTARGADNPSGIRLYRVPPKLMWRGQLCPDVEIIAWHYRFICAPPSIHPDLGTPYRWYDDAGEPLDRIPNVADDYPYLPWAFIAYGTRPPDAPASYEPAAPRRETNWHHRVVDVHARGVAGMREGSRHDVALSSSALLARLEQAGLAGATSALDQLGQAFIDAVASDRGQAAAEAEWFRMLNGGRELVQTTQPRDTERKQQAEVDLDILTEDVPDTTVDVPIPLSFTDAHVGETFAQVIDGKYLYCGQMGGWYRWDGRRWAHDTTEAVYETARRYILALGRHLFETGADADDITRAARYRSRSKLESVVVIARRVRNIAATVDTFDQHPDLLTCRNGTINLRTGELAPPDPDQRITKLTDVDYRPDATHLDVDMVLDTVTPEVRAWLQRLFGYAATGHVNEDILPVFDGTGSNGKTTLLGAVSAALGEYAAPAPAKLLMRSGGDEHPTLIADLFGRRLVYVEETAEGGALRVETMKALTGGSALKARYMRQDYFTFTPTHQLVVATNHRPAVNSTEHATWRRLRLIQFPYRYTRPDEARAGDRTIDNGLRARLHGEPQRRAMLAWVVAGAVAWSRHGLGDSQQITEATGEWRRSEDPILRFVEDRCELDPNASSRSSELHSEYTKWCEAEGRPGQSNKEFTKRLRDHDLAASLEHRRTERGFVWRGIGVKEWV